MASELCTARTGTDAAHCWHDSGYGGGSVSTGSDGTTVSESHGTRVCCHCGVREPYRYRVERAPISHGEYAPWTGRVLLDNLARLRSTRGEEHDDG